MILEPNPAMRIERRTLGREAAPLAVIDQLVGDPARLVHKASRSHFRPQGAMFPGIRARAPLSYEVLLERVLRPLLEDVFGLPREARMAFPMCHYSLVTLAPERLAFLQRIPHIDSTTTLGLATVHYLFRGEWGGTSFYRHRQTGFETVDDARRQAYFDCLHREGEGVGAGEGYIDGDTALFERIDLVEPAFNRMVVYRRNSLHSGDIDNRRIPTADVSTGRLSINSFIDVIP